MSQITNSGGQGTVRRIHLMDEIRGANILLMVAFHWFYTLGWLLDVSMGKSLFFFFDPVQELFAGLFIFICGISCRLSHSNWRRGGLLAILSVGVSLVMWLFMPDQMIWFGILHFFAAGILLFALLRPLLDRIPPLPGLIGCVVLGVLTWHLPYNRQPGSLFGIPGVWTLSIPQSWVSNVWLHPLGFGRAPTPPTDYFPLFPWIFVLLAGSFVGVYAAQNRFPAFAYKSRLPWLAWIGRHTLIIYLLHQPVFYLLGSLIKYLIHL